MNILKKEHFVLIFLIAISFISYFFNDFFQISYLKVISWHFILLLLISLGISTAAKVNSLNLGNEGQIYFGAFFAYLFCSNLDFNYYSFLPILIFISFLVGLMGMIPFFLNYFFGLNQILTTLLISYGNLRLVDGFISEILNKQDTLLLHTESINEIFIFEKVLPYLLLFSILLWLVYIFLYKKTIIGLKLNAFSERKRLNKFFNINEFKYRSISSFNSGFLNGLVGAFFVIFFKKYLFLGITAGIGWTGFIVAILSGFNYFYILFFSFFFSFLTEFNNYLKVNYELKYDLIYFYQAVSIFIALFLMKSGRK